jgi:hypothetical protein
MDMRHHVVLSAISIMALLALPLAAEEEAALSSFGSFDSGSEDSSSESTAPALSIGGVAEVPVRFSVDSGSEAKDAPVFSDPSLRLNFSYEMDKADFEAKLKVNQEVVKNNPGDVLDEMTVRGYLGDFIVEGGKMKLVWGKGDKLHVLDNFNADDYTDFVIPDYIDRRIALPMVRISYNGLDAMHFEAVYTPYMVPDRFATSGIWVPGAYSSTVTGVTALAATQSIKAYEQGMYAAVYQTAYAQAISAGATPSVAAAAAQVAADSELSATSHSAGAMAAGSAAQTVYLSKVSSMNGLYADTKTLKYGQFGFRATGTVGSFDWGASYYYGRRKQPSLNQVNLQAWVKDPGSVNALDYDRLQVFGLEGATAIGPLNFRAEAAYNLTDDVDGTDPYIHNNSIGWVFGFDYGIPLGNLSLNVQTIGAYVLKNDKIGGTDDVDYLSCGKYTNDKIVLSLTDSFFHEKLATECNLIWGVERKDVVVMPKVTYTITDGLDASLSAMYIHGADDSEFASFDRNSFVQAKLSYMF